MTAGAIKVKDMLWFRLRQTWFNSGYINYLLLQSLQTTVDYWVDEKANLYIASACMI